MKPKMQTALHPVIQTGTMRTGGIVRTTNGLEMTMAGKLLFASGRDMTLLRTRLFMMQLPTAMVVQIHL